MSTEPITAGKPVPVACKHQWGPLERYKAFKLDKGGQVKRVDLRERMTCEVCGAADDILIEIKHINGLEL